MAAGIFRGQFKDMKFEQVQGFKISAAFTPRSGFQGRFFVYLWDCIDGDKAFENPIKVVDGDGNRIRDTLTLDSNDVKYSFPDIVIGQAEMGATRAHRYRLVEFGYSRDQTDRGAAADINVKNDNTKKLPYGRLKHDYDFSLDGSAESLFGYRARLLPHGATVIRYSALRNNENSFLKKIIEVNKGQTKSAMPSFKVNFKQGPTEVTQDNLVVVFIDESWGYFTSMPPPSLAELGQIAENADASVVQLSFEDFTPSTLINHGQGNAKWDYATSDTIETATFVFAEGAYPKLDLK